jgi:hypothetical protein
LELMKTPAAQKDLKKFDKARTGLFQVASHGHMLNGDGPMRIRSFVLAFALIVAGPLLSGSADAGLPGIGTFSYNGSSVNMAAQHTLVADAR